MTKCQYPLTHNDLPIERQASRTRHVWVGRGNSIPQLVASLSNCVRLKELVFVNGKFLDQMKLPKSVTKLTMVYVHCRRPMEFPDLQELHLCNSTDESIAAPDLKTLTIKSRNFVANPLALENFPKLHTLDVTDCTPDLIFMVHLADQIMRGWLRVLRLPHATAYLDLVMTCLVPVLKHPGCALEKLEFDVPSALVTRTVTAPFRIRLGMFTLLQARRKPHGKLKRLPIEMFRLVGQML